jgi:hypothetical protein
MSAWTVTLSALSLVILSCTISFHSFTEFSSTTPVFFRFKSLEEVSRITAYKLSKFVHNNEVNCQNRQTEGFF